MSNMIIGDALPNMPWEDKPEGCPDVIWRSGKNPIIQRDLFFGCNSVFNSAVVPWEGGFIGVFRIDLTTFEHTLHVGRSKDGVNWDIEEECIRFTADNEEMSVFEYGYDPRVCKIDDKYYVTWCNGYKGMPTIGVAWTTDFVNFYQLENSFLPFNRNGVLFPKKINGNFAMLSRPSDNSHTPFGDIFYSESPDMTFWGKHRLVMKPTGGWGWMKIGAGPIPIETKEGWLLFYHGVMQTCSTLVYSFSAAILDKDEPWKVKYRLKPYLLSPQKPMSRSAMSLWSAFLVPHCRMPTQDASLSTTAPPILSLPWRSVKRTSSLIISKTIPIKKIGAIAPIFYSYTHLFSLV